MAIDTTVTMVAVEGSYVDFEGNPVVGQIKFALSEMLRNSIANQMIVPSSITVTLDADGYFRTLLPSTNDPDLIPDEFVYHVEESFTNGRSFTISLPYTTVGVLNIADITPRPATSSAYHSMVLQVPWRTLVADITDLDTVVNQPQNAISKSNEYGYLTASEITYAALNAGFVTYAALNAGPHIISPSELAYFSNRASAAAAVATAHASTAASLSSGMMSSLLLLGG